MEYYPAVHLPEDTLLITTVNDANIVTFQNQQGEAVHLPQTVQPDMFVALDFLNEVNLLIRKPGTYRAQDIAKAMDTRALYAHIRSANTILPPGLITYNTQRQSYDTTVTFGRFVIAAAKPTVEQAAEYQAIQAARRAVDSDRRAQRIRAQKEAVLGQEKYKTNLLEHDHSEITFDEYTFRVSLQSLEGIVLARTVAAIQRLAPGERIDMRAVAREVWNAMPLAERRLATKNETSLYGHGSSMPAKIEKQVKQVIKQPLGDIGIATWRPDENISITHKTESPSAKALEEMIPIFPPGTPLEDTIAIIETDISNLREEDRQAARDVLHTLAYGPSIVAQKTAVNLLRVVMNPEGKQALMAELGFNKITLIKTLQAAHATARKSLREGYRSARRNWVIGAYAAKMGNRRAVRHVSGGLPIDTNVIDDTTGTAITDWTVGYQY